MVSVTEFLGKTQRGGAHGDRLFETRPNWTEHVLIGLRDANRYIGLNVSEFAQKDSPTIIITQQLRENCRAEHIGQVLEALAIESLNCCRG